MDEDVVTVPEESGYCRVRSSALRRRAGHRWGSALVKAGVRTAMCSWCGRL